ncbi:MAG: hypothetical protein AB1673_11515, partial [Actinomycetota bacterium]
MRAAGTASPAPTTADLLLGGTALPERRAALAGASGARPPSSPDGPGWGGAAFRGRATGTSLGSVPPEPAPREAGPSALRARPARLAGAPAVAVFEGSSAVAALERPGERLAGGSSVTAPVLAGTVLAGTVLAGVPPTTASPARPGRTPAAPAAASAGPAGPTWAAALRGRLAAGPPITAPDAVVPSSAWAAALVARRERLAGGPSGAGVE